MIRNISRVHAYILLHHAVCVDHPYPNPYSNYPEFAEDLEKEGLLESTGSRDVGNAWYKCTAKGFAWIEGAIKTPLPVQRWIVISNEDDEYV